jgi:hypothetical protein
MIPLKDMHFRVQMQLAPEQEAEMKSAMEAYSRANGGNSAAPGVGYSVEIMSIPEALEYFQAMKLAFDKEQAASSVVTK